MEAVPCHLYIKREMTLSRLEGLAMRKSSRAVRVIVARLRDEEEYDHLRSWTLTSLRGLAEPGDAWAINAIVAPSGPLEFGGTAVKEQALRVLMELSTKASTAAIRAAARALAYAATAKDCQPLKVLARMALEHFAKQAAGKIAIDDSTMTALLALLDIESVETRCTAIRALSLVAPRGNYSVAQGLLKALSREGHERSAKEQLCAVKALGCVASEGDSEVIRVLSECVPKGDVSSPLSGQLSQAALLALRGLSGA